MGKQAEIDYLKNAGEAGVVHSVNKPFSDEACSDHLARLGAILSLLPRHPARLLDLGCGTGWTSIFFARTGYDVVGVDICPDMIFHANQARDRDGLSKLSFAVCDYESMRYADEFDAAVFYSSLHHAEDEEQALRGTFRALRPGGVCITVEPGEGHHEAPSSIEAVKRFGVTEKDMPPRHIMKLARKVGFRAGRVYPSPCLLLDMIFRDSLREGSRVFQQKRWFFNWLVFVRRVVRWVSRGPESVGIVRLVK